MKFKHLVCVENSFSKSPSFISCYRINPDVGTSALELYYFKIYSSTFLPFFKAKISLDIAGLFFSYLVAGIVSLVLALVTNKESFALFVSLPLGIAINLLEIWTTINIIIIMLVVGLGLIIANTKDFVISRKEG